MAMSAKKLEYYADIAKSVSQNSTCLRRKYGAIIVKNDEIISTGYNGSPRGCVNCTDMGICVRQILGTRKGDAYNLCLSVYAEMNAIISAARRDMIGSTMFIVGTNTNDGSYANPSPCLVCHRLILNAGIGEVYGRCEDGEVRKIDVTNKWFMERILSEYERVAQISSMEDGMAIMESVDVYRKAMGIPTRADKTEK